MSQIRKRHSAAFKAKVALKAVKQDKSITELPKQHRGHPVQISPWKKQLLDGRLHAELAWVKKKSGG